MSKNFDGLNEHSSAFNTEAIAQLTDEVARWKGLYEAAVKGRAEFRDALREGGEPRPDCENNPPAALTGYGQFLKWFREHYKFVFSAGTDRHAEKIWKDAILPFLQSAHAAGGRRKEGAR